MKKNVIIVSTLIFLTVFIFLYSKQAPQNKIPIKVGILHSLTGTMAVSEKAVVDATVFAIEEINEAGGVLGRMIKPVIIDGRSDLGAFKDGAEKLIEIEKVSAVFGCWTSASRKTVKPVFEKYNHLLFYPVQYEGLEQSPNIVYTGAAPNQQIAPGVKWAKENLGNRFFLAGSDYIFPQTANAIIKDYVKAIGGIIVGEEYILLGSKDMKNVLLKIRTAKPDVILNTINGDSNKTFFEGLKELKGVIGEIPVMSFSIAENELASLGIENMIGHYACWNYFQSIDSDKNRVFVKKFKEKFGDHRTISDPMEAAYISVNLWAKAVKEADSFDVNDVRGILSDQSFEAPGGLVSLDPATHHIWKTVRVGKIKPDGQFDILWSLKKAVQPVPFPGTRSKSDWKKLLKELYHRWGQHWENPVK